MKKDGIQTRKRKPKSHTSMSGNLPGPSGIHKSDIKPNLLGESSVSKSIVQFILSLTPPINITFHFVSTNIQGLCILMRKSMISCSESVNSFERQPLGNDQDVRHVNCHSDVTTVPFPTAFSKKKESACCRFDTCVSYSRKSSLPQERPARVDARETEDFSATRRLVLGS